VASTRVRRPGAPGAAASPSVARWIEDRSRSMARSHHTRAALATTIFVDEVTRQG
jgi:hypothetical protein